ncbi:histidine kinase [Flavobacteriaceae bacterium S356]|uniref:Histidine kinase n=1 Tax=Asprobacillus argus TaxID=3076534 RepID=A0ABU3LDZ0_9FLAO|nr:histidine kinase [Flavobacteriaceae bacterium S356]
MNKKTNYIWLIVISAIIITLLANVGLFNHFHKLYTIKDPTPANQEEYYYLIRIGFVGVATELLMLVIFAFFNYSWKEKLFHKNNIPLIVLSNLLLVFAFIGMDMYIFKYVTKTHPDLVLSWRYLKDYLINHSLVLTIAIVAPYMLLRMEKAREMEMNLIKIKEEKSIAELSALKEQISPHFFFNTLSTLSSIVRNDTKTASLEFIDDISKTYRYSLSSRKNDLVRLKEELDFIEAYRDVLQKRFGKKLKIAINVSESILLSHIPPMSLQLLIENAIQHNIITSKKPLSISISNSEDSITVKNNLEERDNVESFGIGLMNLNNRYKLIANTEIHIEKTTSEFIVKLPVLI